MKVSFIKMVSNLSFVFVIVNFILCLTEHSPINAFIFSWIIMFYFLLSLKSGMYKYGKLIIKILSILPIFFLNDYISKFAVIFICAVMIYLHRKIMNKISYGETVEEFEKCIFLVIFITIISWLNLNVSYVNQFIIHYAILYMISAIILLRYLRNYEFNAINKDINKINIIYFIFIIISAFVLSLKSVRQTMLSMILFIYKGIMNIALYIFTGAFFLIDYVLGKVFKGVHFKIFDLQKVNIEMKKSPFADVKNTSKNLFLINPILYKILIAIINILLILFVFCILIKILEKKTFDKYKKEECTETKEYIFEKKDKGILLKRINNLFGKTNYSLQIRNYYKKFMEDCIKKGIDLKESDTTLNIYMKSKEAFNETSLWNMRKSYLQTRYANKSCTKQDVKEFYKIYKDKNLKI